MGWVLMAMRNPESGLFGCSPLTLAGSWGQRMFALCSVDCGLFPHRLAQVSGGRGSTEAGCCSVSTGSLWSELGSPQDCRLLMSGPAGSVQTGDATPGL